MSTFLQICKDVCRECSIPQGEDAISAVTGNSGQVNRIVNWVANSWRELQDRHNNWRWMRVGFTVNTVADDDTYAYTDCTDVLTSAAISRFSRWRIQDDDNRPKCYLQSAGVGSETWLTYVEWDWFKSIYRIGTQTASQPQFISIDPQNNIVLGPKPNDVYVVTGDYQRSAQVLAADDDEPECPVEYHDAIMYLAMKKYGGSEAAQEILYRFQEEGIPLIRQLEMNQLPEIPTAGPLA